MVGKKCRLCGCTDGDCRQCIERTGEPCCWITDDLCSACAPRIVRIDKRFAIIRRNADNTDDEYWNAKRRQWIASKVIHGGSALNPKASFFGIEQARKIHHLMHSMLLYPF